MSARRFTVASPDGLGDFVLRIPLVEALLASGAVQLVMRPPAADLARELFPQAEVLELEKDPFRQETKKERGCFRRATGAIRRFDPDLYVASAFQLSFFDEVFLSSAAEVPAAGFRSSDDFWSSDTSVDPRLLASRFSPGIAVPTDMPEGRKSRVLAEALTGTVAPARVTRAPTARSLEQARRILQAHDLRERDFAVVCAGSRPGLAMKDWGEANWAALLAETGKSADSRFVFLGNAKEHDSIARLCSVLPPATRPVNLAAEPPPVAVSHALISLSRAYLGRDSGLMHLAALAGVPVVAVFAGGHWPRFVPEAERGIVMTRAAPCRGCNFHCPFPEPWCVKTVPVEFVARAWKELPRTDALRVVELPAGEEWLSMARELDVPAYAREQSVAARTAVAELRNESAWKKLFAGLTSR